jgi:hypothetical protein
MRLMKQNIRRRKLLLTLLTTVLKTGQCGERGEENSLHWTIFWGRFEDLAVQAKATYPTTRAGTFLMKTYDILAQFLCETGVGGRELYRRGPP